MRKGPLLPEWRWWPGIALAALIAVAIAGSTFSTDLRIGSAYPPAASPTKGGITDGRSFLGLTGDGWTAVLTGVLIFLTWRASQHFRVTERAYVKMSHYPPGLYWERPDYRLVGQPCWVRVDIQVKNFGHTPAEVTRILVTKKILPKGENLDVQPDYSNGRASPIHASLVTDDKFTHPERMELSAEEANHIWNADRWLYIYGYVEYTDKFGMQHRAGYARRYARGRDNPNPFSVSSSTESVERTADVEKRNNLVFVELPGYNYDQSYRWSMPDA